MSLLTALYLNHLVKATLEVGPGKPYSRIEDAVTAAHHGDTILVYPSPDGYPKTAIRITIPSLTIRGVAGKPVEIKGDGFNYSGSGSVPRAIFQIEPAGMGATIQNFNLSGAHNHTFNGAGVRIQAASNVTVTDCVIHDNDMGIMSNGIDGDAKAGSRQEIRYCLIERNGNTKDPGYNHNLYLSGADIDVYRCEIAYSLTGHNLKSRAHSLHIFDCFIHDAANREVDLVDSWNTKAASSDVVISGCRIVKSPTCSGNRGVIHFGQEAGIRTGSLSVSGSIIVTPFSAPVIEITSPETRLSLYANTFINPEQTKADLWKNAFSVQGQDNWLSSAYAAFSDKKTDVVAKSRGELFGTTPPTYLMKKPRDTTIFSKTEMSLIILVGCPTAFVGPRSFKDQQR